jgi:outer membrane protein assembly factor BamD (BamD/ComL family)
LKVVSNQRNPADRGREPHTHTGAERRRAPRGRQTARLLFASLCVCACVAQTGCLSIWPFQSSTSKSPPPETSGPVDGMVLRGGELVKDTLPKEGTPEADLEAAKRLYQEGDYVKAEPLLGKIGGNTKNPVGVAEEAMYYQAECHRLQGKYPRAAELYCGMVNTFPFGKHGNQARQRMFDIANYWLDDTRAYMELCKEKKEGKRKWVWPMAYLHFDKTKPTFDEEGHAIRMLEGVYITDPTGPLAEKALFYLGSIKFFREDYREADHYFDQLRVHHPNGKLAPKAVEMSIICKQMSTGGSEYDGRTVSEARELVQVAFNSYPELSNNRSQFLKDQLYSIAQQQADKDFNIAEYYRRVGKPGPAYFQYALVVRRFPGTQYAQKATERMNELRAKLEKGQAKPEVPPIGTASPSAPPRASITGPYTPGAPLETAPAPNVLPPSMNDGKR